MTAPQRSTCGSAPVKSRTVLGASPDFDAHHPYNPPLRCRDAFSGRLDRFDRQAGIRETAKRLHIDGKPIRPEVRAHHVSLYGR